MVTKTTFLRKLYWKFWVGLSVLVVSELNYYLFIYLFPVYTHCMGLTFFIHWIFLIVYIWWWWCIFSVHRIHWWKYTHIHMDKHLLWVMFVGDAHGQGCTSSLGHLLWDQTGRLLLWKLIHNSVLFLSQLRHTGLIQLQLSAKRKQQRRVLRKMEKK